MFRKSENENAIQWAINQASLSYQSIAIFCSQMSVSEIRFKADATTCFSFNIEIMTQYCLESRHYQEFFLKHRVWASLNVDVSTLITKILVLIYSVLKLRYDLNKMGLRCRRRTNYAEDGPAMKEWDH